MTLREKIYTQIIICKIAIKERTTPTMVRAAIREALDEAWAAAWTPGNLRAQVAWQRLFPGSVKPTIEQAVSHISRKIKQPEEDVL